MGTNYYAVFDEKDVLPAPACDDGPNIVHLGKSSIGWRFSLHVYPEQGIMNLLDVMSDILFTARRIQDEYKVNYTIAEFLEIVTERERKVTYPIDIPAPLQSYIYRIHNREDLVEYYRDHLGYELDDKNLIIHPIDRDHCIGNAKNRTFDFIIGQFF